MLSTDPLDIKLDPADGDLYVGPNGLELVSGLDGVAQLIGIAVRLTMGELFVNLTAGVPWDEILGEKFDDSLIRQRLSEAIGRVPGVDAITSVSVSFNPTTRAVDTSWEVRVKFDDTGPDTLAGTTSVGENT